MATSPTSRWRLDAPNPADAGAKAAPAREPKATPPKAEKKPPQGKKTPPASPPPAQEEPEKAKMGRPTLYKPEYCQKLLDYFDIEPRQEVTRQVVAKDGSVATVTMEVPNELPTLAGFCCLIGTHRETLLNWSKAHPDFFDALKRAKEHQERIMLANGMTGFYDKTFAIFVSKNVLGYRDQIDTTVDTPGGELSGLLKSISARTLPICAKPGEDDE